ncbi:MAG TPA: NAD(P) transhydrogenase subunit alpha [Desulfobacteraceae bacterium]|nr:MAG: NAD(P) transhydrogenase subunit alpha [Deltaproteobacteria bacterium]HDI59113.1 NAD(P) transhydrogenase subunit alpha [Desulfobacteraceae bacterium]
MTDLFFALVVFAVSFAIGDRLIRRVPPMLHTPLMSMTNAISAVVILGALALLATDRAPGQQALIAAAVAAAAFNIVGGFAITGRMLRMFRSEGAAQRSDGA